MNAKEFVDLARQSYPNLPDAKTLSLLEADTEFRFAVCSELNKSISASDRELVRYITNLNIKLFDNSWDSLDPLRLCGLLLFKIGNVEDSVLLWQVKTLDFDTYAGLDTQMLVGAGIDETIAYLKSLNSESALKAVDNIEMNRANFIDDHVAGCSRYFGFEGAG